MIFCSSILHLPRQPDKQNVKFTGIDHTPEPRSFKKTCINSQSTYIIIIWNKTHTGIFTIENK